MGLDIYAGTLTRYYSHNWKTVVQQWAEENGYSFNRITPDGEPADNEEEMSPAEVQAAVENWRDQILSAISQPGQPPYPADSRTRNCGGCPAALPQAETWSGNRPAACPQPTAGA